MKTSKLILLSSLAALSLALPQAQAAENTAIVHYQPQELATQYGLRSVYNRIVAVAKSVCGERTQPGSRLPSTEWKVCFDRAVDGALAQVDSQKLYAYHALRVQSRAV